MSAARGLSLLPYLIVVLVIGAVLGPLMAVLPTKRQRALAELREAASARGLLVRLRKVPDVPPRLRFQPPPDLMCYEYIVESRRGPRWQPGMFVRGETGWQSPDGDRLVPDVLERLPQGAVLAVLGWQSVQVFWDERGDENAIDTVATVMRHLVGSVDSADDDLSGSA